MKKKYAILFVTLCSLLSGCGAKEAEQQEEVTARAVEVLTIEKGKISNTYVYAGKVKALEEAQVFTTVPGKADKVYCDVGDTVEKGQVLFDMDKTDLINNLNVLKASLATSEANVKSAKTALDTVNGAAMQSQIEAAKAGFKNAEVAYQNAKQNYENNKELYAAGIISKSQMDQFQMAYDTATVTYEQAKKNYDITVNKMPQENLRKAQDGYDIALASKASVEAQIASAEKNLQDASVKSPISGVVTSKNVVPGTVVSQAAPAFTVMDTSKVEITVEVSEQVINTLKSGQSVDVKLTVLSEAKQKGTITTVSPAASTAGTYEVKVQLENPKGIIKVGMLGEVYFEKETSENTIVVPRDCVITKNKETYVYIEQDGVAKKVNVKTGIDTGDDIEIIEGLTEGMHLISKGQTYLEDGTAVKISNSEKGE